MTEIKFLPNDSRRLALKQLRHALQMSRATLARIAGKSLSSVDSWESGRRTLTPETWLWVCRRVDGARAEWPACMRRARFDYDEDGASITSTASLR